MTKTMRRLLAGALVIGVGLSAPFEVRSVESTAFAGDADKSVEASAVFYGDMRSWEKPAALDDDAVYREIPEYQEVCDKKLATDDPKYGILMSKARAKFRRAVRKVAKDKGFDLVARVGSVRGVDDVPVVTQDVVSKL